jgi:hypothetical protein
MFTGYYKAIMIDVGLQLLKLSTQCIPLLPLPD